MSPTYYRIQPVGCSLRHVSGDWSGKPLPDGRLCAYCSIEALLAGEGDDWYREDWRGGGEGPREVVEFTGRSPRSLDADVAGISVLPGRVLKRTPLAKFLSQHSKERDHDDPRDLPARIPLGRFRNAGQRQQRTPRCS